MESRLDGGATSAFKLVVEVASARLENHESACVELNFNGQRHRTAVKENYQDERFYFDVSDPFSLQELALEAYVYDVDPSTSRTYSFIGKPQKQGPQKQGRFSCTGTAKGRFSYTGTAGTLSLKVYTVGITTSMSAQEPRMASFHSAAASSMRLCVEVVTAVDLMPKEDQVFASAFVVLAFDSWKVRTSTKFKDVNPVWDESFYFSVPDQHAPLVLEASVYSVNMSLFGKVRVRPCVPPHFDPHVVYYPLEKNGVFSPYARGLLGLRLNITSNKASIRAQEPNIASLHSTAMRLCVEVVSAHDLPPKDDQGSASAFVVLTFDHCQFRTLVKEKDLNPVWNERFYFNVWDPSNLHMIDINAYVYHVVSSAKRSKTLLGKVRIDGALWGPFPDAILMHYPLAKHRIFSPVKGDLSLKVYTIYNPTITTQKPSPPSDVDAVQMHYSPKRPWTFSRVKGDLNLKLYTTDDPSSSITISNPFPPIDDALLIYSPPEKPRMFSHVEGDLIPKVYAIDDHSITASHPSPPTDTVVYVNDDSIRSSNTSPQIDSAISPPDVPLSSTLERKLQKQCSRPHEIPLQHLKEITDNFSDDRILGQGGFGVVYKGVQRNGEVVAVKKIKSSFMPGMQRQFENEVCHLMMLKHPNVVRCKGYCYETRNECLEYNGKYVFAEIAERLLSLEYLPNGSLDKYISDESSGLDWSTRYKIIEGICAGLCHLHEQNNKPIVHMDLKPANILLDDGMVPKITDFGLSRLLDQQQTICTKSCDGTFGYMAPEFLHGGTVTPKSDIFSLGVIIMEIVTGHRHNLDVTSTSSNDFIKLVLNNWRSLLQISVGCGSLQTYCQQIEICLHVGLICVNPDRTKRPPIRKVISMLQGSESIDCAIINDDDVA
ncbi:hypothetical protein ACQ4PT_064322 [Festuca glaucescens]